MKKGYPWIDKMRMIAAILVIAIHVSPFIQINTTADFILTRVLGRLAVPFFFVTTSYFLFIDGYPSKEKIQKTILALLKWYMISICLYIPLMIYNHYFDESHLLVQLIKDLFVDGTFYHLWYFPAIILGIIIVLLLKKIFSSSITLLITVVLYSVGLCGDSYYGLVYQLPLCQDVLTFLFQYMDYTRNGFFFAPLFVMIGSLIHEQKKQFTLQGNIFMLIMTLIMMGSEAWILHIFKIPRHDSMYIMLPLVSYFLFNLLIRFQGQRYLDLKNISLFTYIIHPFMIVIVRMIGKLIHMQLLISHNFIQFICVTILSVGLSIIVNQLLQRGESHERTNV